MQAHMRGAQRCMRCISVASHGTVAAVTGSTRRMCQCGARLASDNSEGRCGPCQRRATDQESKPPTPPAGFWDAPEIRDALEQRHFGQLMMAYRRTQTPIITQAEVGRWLGLTQSQVSRVERSQHPPHDLDKLEQWAAALGIPEDRLWFAVNPPRGSTNKATVGTRTSEEESVRRRQFVRSVGAGALQIGSTLLDHRTPHAGHTETGSRPPDVEIREMARRFRDLDNRYGGGRSRGVVTAYLSSIVEPQLKEPPRRERDRASLFTAVAEMQQLAAWMFYDIGHPTQGRHHLREALRLCQDAGDDALVGEMFAGMSHHAAFRGSSESAVDLAIAAQQAAHRSGVHALQAEAAVMEAHGLAQQGERSASLRALRDAEHAFSAANGQGRPEWLGYFDHAYLAAKFAHSFRDLGMFPDAERFARRSLEMSDGYERGRMFNTALLASTIAEQGRVEEACETANQALQISTALRSSRAPVYLGDIARRLKPYYGHHSVRSLYERMAATGLAATPA